MEPTSSPVQGNLLPYEQWKSEPRARSLDTRVDRASPESQPWLQTHTWRVALTTRRLYPFPLWARTTRLTPAAEDFPRTRPQGSEVQGLDVAGDTVQLCSDMLLSPYKGSLSHRRLCGGITDSPPRTPVHNHRVTNISFPYRLSGQSLMYTVLHTVTLVTTHTPNPVSYTHLTLPTKA